MDLFGELFATVWEVALRLTDSALWSLVLVGVVDTLLLSGLLSQAMTQRIRRRSAESVAFQQLLQPQLDRMKEIWPDGGATRETLNRKTMEFWKHHDFNPMSGCFPLLGATVLAMLIGLLLPFGLYLLLSDPTGFSDRAIFGELCKPSSDPTCLSAFGLAGLDLLETPLRQPGIGVGLLVSAFVAAGILNARLGRTSDASGKTGCGLILALVAVLLFLPSGLLLYLTVRGPVRAPLTWLSARRLKRSQPEVLARAEARLASVPPLHDGFWSDPAVSEAWPGPDEQEADAPPDAPPPCAVLILLSTPSGAASFDEPVVVDMDRFSIGSDGANDLVLDTDPEIARHHCRLLRREGRFLVEACDSAGGVTEVDGDEIDSQWLFGGEELRLAETRIQFRLLDDQDPVGEPPS